MDDDDGIVVVELQYRSFCTVLLKTAAHGGDALRIEAEPVHAADVAGVLDLDAAIHDHRETAGFGDARAFLVDHRELTPQRPGAYRDGLACDLRQRIRRTKHVDDVDVHRDVGERVYAVLAED